MVPTQLSESSSGFRTQVARPPPRRILIVDDNPIAADSVAKLLEFMGHATAVAYDGVTAVNVARVFNPDAVLLDLAMPGEDGFGIAYELREMFGTSLRLVALSGFARDQFPTAFGDAGFDAHILKPATAETLERVLLS
jgi:CheY-like chemotaxis protein